MRLKTESEKTFTNISLARIPNEECAILTEDNHTKVDPLDLIIREEDGTHMIEPIGSIKSGHKGHNNTALFVKTNESEIFNVRSFEYDSEENITQIKNIHGTSKTIKGWPIKVAEYSLTVNEIPDYLPS